MNRIPTTFAYPVVYPNGAVVYCETEEEANMLRQSLKNLENYLKENEDE